MTASRGHTSGPGISPTSSLYLDLGFSPALMTEVTELTERPLLRSPPPTSTTCFFLGSLSRLMELEVTCLAPGPAITASILSPL